MTTSLNALSMVIGMNTDQVMAGVNSIRQQMGRANRIMQMAKTDTDRLAEGTKSLAVAFHKGAIDQAKLEKGLKVLNDRYGDGAKLAKQAAEAQERVRRMVDASIPKTTKLAQEIRFLRSQYAAGNITADQFKRTNERLRTEYDRLKVAARQTGQQMAQTASMSKMARIEALSQLPVIGHLTGRVTALSGQLSVGATAFTGMGAGAAAAVAPLAAVVAGAVGVTVAVKATVAGVNKLIDQMAKLDPAIKEARAIGALVGDVQGLAGALDEVAGMDLSATTRSLSELQKRIGETIMGTGEGKMAFQQLGLSAERLSRMVPTRQFTEVAAALQRVKSASLQTALAQKIFGEQGRVIVNGLMIQGSTLDALTLKHHQMGLSLQQWQAAGIEAANDSLGDLHQRVDGLVTQLSASFAPMVTAVSRYMGQWAPNANALGLAMEHAVTEGTRLLGATIDIANVIKGISELGSGTTALKGWERIQSGWSGEAAKELTGNLRQAREEAAKAAAADQQRIGAMGQMGRGVMQQVNGFQQMRQQLQEQIVALRHGEQAAERMRMSREGLSKQQIDQLQNMQRIADRLKAEQQRRQAITQQAEIATRVERQRLEQLVAMGQRARQLAGTMGHVGKQFRGMQDEAHEMRVERPPAMVANRGPLVNGQLASAVARKMDLQLTELKQTKAYTKAMNEKMSELIRMQRNQPTIGVIR